MKKKKEEDKGPKMKRLHWEKMKDVTGTIWEVVKQVDGAGLLDALFADVQDNFLVKEKVKDPNAAPKKAKKTEVALIEPNRARSMAIMLGNLTQHGKRPIEEIGQAILSMDEASLGGLDGIESILLNSPNQEEISMLQTFERDHTDEVDQLGKAEMFTLVLSRVPQVRSRLRAMHFKLRLADLESMVRVDIGHIREASNQLKGSPSFQTLLQVVLKIGNLLNEGMTKGNAEGVKMSGLMKLEQTKTITNKTLLHYIISKLMGSDHPAHQAALNWMEEIPGAQKASRSSLQTATQDVGQIKSGVSEIKRSLEAAQKENSEAGQAFVASMSGFAAEAEATCSSVEAEFKAAQEIFSATCKYLGEPGLPKAKPEDFFGIILKFANLFTATVKKIGEDKERLERKEAIAQSKADILAKQGGKPRSAPGAKFKKLARAHRESVAKRPDTLPPPPGIKPAPDGVTPPPAPPGVTAPPAPPGVTAPPPPPGVKPPSMPKKGGPPGLGGKGSKGGKGAPPKPPAGVKPPGSLKAPPPPAVGGKGSKGGKVGLVP